MERPEQRADQRYPFRLSLEYWPADDPDPLSRCRTVTEDVSPSGVRFESAGPQLRVGTLLSFHIAAPPGPGHYPVEVGLTGTGQVVRLQPAGPKVQPSESHPPRPARQGVAARFTSPLQIVVPDH